MVFGIGLRPCLVFLACLWLAFMAAGFWFFLWVQKKYPHPLRHNDIRARLVKPWRFAVYVLLMPVGVTCAFATWLVWAADEGIIPEF